MALGIVQTGCRNSLYAYPAQSKLESERSYAEWLAELTTELELALEGRNDESVEEEHTEEDSGQSETHSGIKKEWEELLEQTEAVDAILRQMLENGLGQRKEEQQEKQEENQLENLDNEFDLNAFQSVTEGDAKDASEYAELRGNSAFLQTNGGEGSEYWNPSNSGRRQSARPHTICLTCKTECERKKQWKITE